ncbi:MAG: transketolase [Candidatus Buchananbacteria bacterium RIFCSPHIGHO2_02_FULL_56_16]|uniref:Transketolase n=1 Tax=Candidatus Buchananbacteria bacterium RIFCSPHIGHO2_02_FULL_56_16 TaxID=1797542 RepID=A0A1G1YG84_9BACT|nr:MAG: transketolase [Candidatus Buchananbacteria bacterium RIFCSPHIGHO2_02_FULL_56_16]
MRQTQLQNLAALIRSLILTSTTKAGSGHPTSALSATDLMTGLLFGGAFRFDVKRPDHPNNDRLIFSKGHASPLLYALWAVAGGIKKTELTTYRRFGSRLEGHPTMTFTYTEAATGSLGQGLPIGVGMALNAKYVDTLPYTTYVLLGDAEMAEGSQWEALQLTSYYKLNNLVGILDVNRLGQRGQTMLGYNLDTYRQRIAAFGWQTIVIDGHDLAAIVAAYQKAAHSTGKPTMIIARTIKGKGVPFLENKNGWHGKAVPPEQLAAALEAIGPVDATLTGEIKKPLDRKPKTRTLKPTAVASYALNESVPTRKAYGQALLRLLPKFPNVVVLDAEVSNSTFAETVKERYPDHFFEMHIAEQNMVGAALGFSRRGKIPFVSTFAAFFTRAFDQIRMSPYSDANIKFVGSHAGVSIGEDGASQMGLEDIAMFRTLNGSTVLYPADANSTLALVDAAARSRGIVYLRTTRKATPVIYKKNEPFPIGGSKVLKQSTKDVATVVAAGITLFEALKAAEALAKEKISIRIIDLYSIKPLDVAALKRAAKATGTIITVEDHFPEGGIGEAVAAALGSTPGRVVSLAVRKMPKSGKPEQLLEYEGISAKAILKEVKKIIG